MEKWVDFEEWCRATGKKVYMCMVCKKKYAEGSLPTIDKENQRGDGCCTVGSLIELGKGIKQQMEEADKNKEVYEDFPNSVEEFVELIEEIYKKANNEKPNNARTKRSPNRS